MRPSLSTASLAVILLMLAGAAAASRDCPDGAVSFEVRGMMKTASGAT